MLESDTSPLVKQPSQTMLESEASPLVKPLEVGASEGGNRLSVYLNTGVAAIGGLLFGYDTGVISGAILFIEDEFNLTSFEVELVVSVALIAAAVGALMGGPASDSWGRKPVILVASFLFAAGSAVLAAATGLAMLLIGRVAVGLAIGVAADVVPVYLAEIAPSEQRGALVTVNNLGITFGQFVSYLVDSGFASVSNGWRYMLGLAAVPALAQLAGVLLITPESPRWLVKFNRREQARAVLQKLRKREDVSEELSQIEASFQAESGSWWDLLSPAVRPALLVGTALQMFQQLCGINTAMYYSPKILQMSGFHENREAILFADAVAFANALFTALAIWLVERVGRRKLLLGTLPGVVLSLIGLGLSFRETDDGTASGPLVALTCLVFYVIFFAPGLGVIPWCVNAEIYPLSVRATAACIATAVNWISNFIVSVTFLSYVELVGADGAFLTYAAIGVVAWCFFYFMLPETQGLTIEEIQQTFRQGREQPASSEPAAGPSEK